MPRPLAAKTDPAKTALVVIDVQNDFCHPDGVFPKLGADISAMAPTAARIKQLVAAARQADMLILWVRATYDPVVRGAAFDDALDKPDQTADACLAGTFGAEWIDGLGPDPDAASEVELIKHRYSAFWDTAIDLYLRSNAIENVVLTGVITSGCVESTGRDAFFRNYFVVIPEDTCASYSRERHDASLRKFAQTMGTVPASADVLALWRAAPAGPRNWHLDEKRKRASHGLPQIADPAHTALLIIDMQNDFCHADGGMAQRGADIAGNRAVIPAIADLLDQARAAGVMVLHVQANYGQLSGGPAWLFGGTEASVALDICLPGSWGAQQVDELAPRDGELVVVKHRYSAFVDTRLETLLRSNHIETVVCCGTATMACVESTVRDAMMRDYRAIVPRDAVAARGHMKALHDASLETMGAFFALTPSVAELTACWPSQAKRRA